MKRYHLYLNGRIVRDAQKQATIMKYFKEYSREYNSEDNSLSVIDRESGETIITND